MPRINSRLACFDGWDAFRVRVWKEEDAPKGPERGSKPETTGIS